MSESVGDNISEALGDFVGISNQDEKTAQFRVADKVLPLGRQGQLFDRFVGQEQSLIRHFGTSD
jgi:hypothetical protein